MATKAWQISERVIGDAAKRSGGSGIKGSGFHEQTRTNAGVVRDVPAPASWLELAAELPGAPQSQPAKRKPGFIETCDIRDGIAHVSPDTFRTILVSRKMNDLRNAGAASIVIEDGGDFRAELVFEQEYLVPAADERITLEDILKYGVTTALKGRESATLTSTIGKHGMATLYSSRQSPDLGQAFSFSAAPGGDASSRQSVLFSSFLMAAVSRPLALRQIPLGGLELSLPGTGQPTVIARAWQPAEWLEQGEGRSLDEFTPVTIQSLGRKLRTVQETECTSPVQGIFGQSAGYLMHLRRHNRENVDPAATSIVIVPAPQRS